MNRFARMRPALAGAGIGGRVPPRGGHAVATSPRRDPVAFGADGHGTAGSRPAGRLLQAHRLPDHADRMFRAAYALCGSPHDAEDLVQETYARVLRRPRFVRRDDDLGYLLRALRNTWIAMHRGRTARPDTVHIGEEVEWIADPGADPAGTTLQLREAYAAISRLSDPLREAIVAVDVVGLSYRQAARALRIREGTVMSRLARARERVIEQMEAAA